MLILTRRAQEALIIGDNTKVVVLGVQGEQVKIGIAAKADIPVYRGEVYRRLQEGKGNPKSGR